MGKPLRKPRIISSHFHDPAVRAACSPIVESVLGGFQSRPTNIQRRATEPPAIVEPLEPRVHLTTTFTANVAGTAGGAHTSGFSVNLWTTGGAASQWVVHWGDGTPASTYYASAQPGGVFPVPFTPSPPHTYVAGNYSITATATTAGGTSSTATYGLVRATISLTK